MFKHRFFIRKTLIAFIGLAVVWRIGAVPYAEADDKHERGRMEDIMDVVAKDIEKHFYDPKLKAWIGKRLPNARGRGFAKLII
jgi:hypothetical protein